MLHCKKIRTIELAIKLLAHASIIEFILFLRITYLNRAILQSPAAEIPLQPLKSKYSSVSAKLQ